MSYPQRTSERCPHCSKRFFTPYSLAAHVAQEHYETERDQKSTRMKRNVDLVKESRARNETPNWWKP